MPRHSYSVRVIAARAITSFIGLVLFVYGVIAFLSPLPAGAPLAVLGLLMIAAANPAARPLIRRLRKRWRWFDRIVRVAGKRGPPPVREVEQETAPEFSED